MSHAGSIDVFLQAFNAQATQPQPPELRDMRLDSMRIVSRLQILQDPVRLTYIPPGVQDQIRTITDEHDTIMTQWLPPVREEDLRNNHKVAAHTQRMSDAYNQLIPLFNTWGQPSLREIIGNQIEADGRIDRGCAAWTQILSLDTLQQTTAPQLVNFITQQLVAWRRPRLRTWLMEAGLEAANGYLRIKPLGQFAGAGVHLTLYIANIDLDGDLSITDGVNNVIDTLLPDVDGSWRGTHITFEAFGQDDQRNPKFFKPNNFKFNNSNAAGLTDLNTTPGDVSNHLSNLLTTEIVTIRNRLTNFMATRNAGLH
jgi:hypothetical protein